jgi:hypothetical protein
LIIRQKLASISLHASIPSSPTVIMGLPMPVTTEKPSVSETKETATGTTTTNQGQPQSQSQEHQKSEAELAAEREYLERMEDEYAKREGGA